MGSSHVRGHTVDHETAPSRASTITLGAIAVALFIATIVGLIALWPNASQVPQTQLLAPGVELLEATVDEVPADPQLGTVSATGVSDSIAGESIEVHVTADVLSGMHEGDRIRIISVTGATDPAANAEAAQTYSYFDHERKLPLGLLFVLYLLVVVLVARGRGLRAVLGLSVGVGVVAWFLAPALLSGVSPTLVALVAAGAMIFPSVYIAHGISIRTTTAVIGTCAGIAAFSTRSPPARSAPRCSARSSPRSASCSRSRSRRASRRCLPARSNAAPASTQTAPSGSRPRLRSRRLCGRFLSFPGTGNDKKRPLNRAARGRGGG
ncbi:YibE/F family protein [Gulosibacter sp. ACHW.36C]|uniref:YibE/F family protein n=1 Tax=Gulosibacter sediminis TaxID=1729695 RepID=A0ABY4MYZ4_9MICO|nr:YibE/F family protein [Gulosibacter sediminis]UQN15661.1 YibE/F family protein [Gulosibacter sediminis]